MDSAETVIRFRQSPSEGDITSYIISIVSDVSTGYIVKNGSGWWYTWVWEGDSTHFQWEITMSVFNGYIPKNGSIWGGGGGGGGRTCYWHMPLIAKAEQ